MSIKTKFVKTAIAACLGAGLSMGAHAAPVLVIGDLAFKINGVNFFNAPDNGAFGGVAGNGMSDLPGFGGVRDTQPLHPATIAGNDGRTWGIAKVTSIHQIVTGDIENPGALSAPIWTETATDHLSARFGGMTMSHLSPAAPSGFPYDIYFGLDAAAARPAGPGGIAYLEIYNNTTDDFVTDAGLSAGNGTYNSFGNTIDNGALWLDLALVPGILSQVDPLAALPGDIEKTTISGLTTGGATIYADVLTVGSPLNSGLLPLFPIAPTGVKADMKLQATIVSMFNPSTPPGTWTDPNWTTLSNDPITGASIPEPATLFLMGAGLVGFGVMRRRKAA